MNIQRKHSGSHMAPGLLALLAASVMSGALTYIALGGAAAKGTEAETGAVTSRVALFSFDAQQAPGWHRAGLDASSEEGRGSILLFDRNMTSGAATKDNQSCHVSASMKLGSVDPVVKFRELEGDTSRNLALVEPQELSLRVTDGELRYVLNKYHSPSPRGGSKIKEGYAYGYVVVDDKYYIEIQAVCDTPAALDTAIPAIKALSFNTSAPRH